MLFLAGICIGMVWWAQVSAKSPAMPAANSLGRLGPFHFRAGPVNGLETARKTIFDQQADDHSDLPRIFADATRLVVKAPLARYQYDPTRKRLPTCASDLDAAGCFGYFYVVEESGKRVADVVCLLSWIDRRSGVRQPTQWGCNLLPWDEVADAITHLASLEQLRSGSYEPRLLYVFGPSSIPVLWLKSDSDGGDLFYTLRVISEGQINLEHKTLFSEKEFFSLMQQLAKP